MPCAFGLMLQCPTHLLEDESSSLHLPQAKDGASMGKTYMLSYDTHLRPYIVQRGLAPLQDMKLRTQRKVWNNQHNQCKISPGPRTPTVYSPYQQLPKSLTAALVPPSQWYDKQLSQARLRTMYLQPCAAA